MKKDNYLASARITPYTGSYPENLQKVTLYCICKITNSYEPSSRTLQLLGAEEVISSKLL